MSSVILSPRLAAWCSLPLWICALYADVTLRYESEAKMASFLPPEAREKAQTALEKALPDGMKLYLKDGQAWTHWGTWTSILDYPTQRLTLFDEGAHTFCALPVTDFYEKMSALSPKFGQLPDMQVPEEQKKAMADMMAKMMANIKTSVDSKLTGRTETILGVEAEERESTVTIEIPMPMAGAQSSMNMKIVSQTWTARQEETLKNQAVRELSGYNLYANYFFNPATMWQNMAVPGLDKAMKAITDGLSKGTQVMLRSRMSMYMPMAAAALSKGQTGNVDPNAPTFEMKIKAVEISSAPVDKSRFEVPAGYKPVPVDELLKGLINTQRGTAIR